MPTLSDLGVDECHYYKYTGALVTSNNISEAKSQLRSQINSDPFKNKNQQTLLIFLVEETVKEPLKDYDIIRFRFVAPGGTQNGKVDVYDRDTNGVEKARELFPTKIDAGGESEGLIYINIANQIVEIVYPLICNLGNFGT